jgi:hypothetical protein
MKDKNYSWMGSPNAGLFLTMVAAISGLMIIVAGFGH